MMTRTSYVPYLIVVVTMFAIATAGAVYLETARPENDNLPLILIIFGIVTTSTPAIFGFMKSQEASDNAREAIIQTKETHDIVNSKMSKAIKDAVTVALAEELARGIAIGRERADIRTDVITAQKDAQVIAVATAASANPPPVEVTPVQIVGTSSTVPVEIVEKHE